MTVFAYSNVLGEELKLWAGSATTDITPEVGMEIPGGFKKNISDGVHDPLEVNALVFKLGENVLALLSVDALALPYDILQTARNKLGNQTILNPQNIVVSASHTHCGGPICSVFSSERNPSYCALVVDKIVEAIRMACENLKEAKISITLGELNGVAFNRRFYMKNGKVVTHPGKGNPDIIHPAGPEDNQIISMFVVDETGKPISILVNYTLHATVLGGRKFSADYIHYLRAFLRKQWDAPIPIVFMNGACGDVTQVDNRNPNESEFGEVWAKRIGELLGTEVYSQFLWANFFVPQTLTMKTQVLDINFRDFSSYRITAEIGLGSGGEDIYSREIELLDEMKKKMKTLKVEICAVRIGDLAIISNPTEMFCRLGIDIKKSSPAKFTVISELTNGYTGYCPTPEAFSEGGYEIRTARSSCMEPEAGIKIVQVSRSLLAQLFSESQ